MKTFFKQLFLILLLLTGVQELMASNFTTPEGIEVGFASFAVFVAFIPIIVETLKRLFKMSEKTHSLVVQLVSWLTGIVLALVGWVFGLGMFIDMTWYYALLYGLGGALASNGVADIGFVQWFFNILFSKKNVQG